LVEIGDPEVRLILDFLIESETGGLAQVAGELHSPELEVDDFDFRVCLGISGGG